MNTNNVGSAGVKITIIPEVQELIRQAHKIWPHMEWLSICRIINTGPGKWEVNDICFPPQDNSGAYVETADKEDYGIDWSMWFYDRLEQKYGEERYLEKDNNWKFQLHSHNTMGTSPSGVDQTNKMQYANQGHQWMFNGRTNYTRKGDEIIPGYKVELNVYQPYPVEFDVTVEALDMKIPDTYEADREAIITKYFELSDKEIVIEDDYESLSPLIKLDDGVKKKLKDNAKTLKFSDLYEAKMQKELEDLEAKTFTSPIADRITQVVDNQFRKINNTPRGRNKRY